MFLNGCCQDLLAGTDARVVRLLALLVRGLEKTDLEGCLSGCGLASHCCVVLKVGGHAAHYTDRHPGRVEHRQLSNPQSKKSRPALSETYLVSQGGVLRGVCCARCRCVRLRICAAVLMLACLSIPVFFVQRLLVLRKFVWCVHQLLRAATECHLGCVWLFWFSPTRHEGRKSTRRTRIARPCKHILIWLGHEHNHRLKYVNARV